METNHCFCLFNKPQSDRPGVCWGTQGAGQGRIGKDKTHLYGTMIEPILLGIVLGLIGITLAGLFFAAYQQYRRQPR